MEGASRLCDADQRSLWIQGLQRFRHDHLQLSLDDLPSLTDLEIALRRVRKNKAIGLDMIPPELCHACPTILARQLYGALLKLVCHGQEALPHKGGLLTPAFKGKGSPCEASSYRSLLVSSHIGKALHRTVRQTQATLLEAFMVPQQLGGRRRVPVTLGLHEARAFLRSRQGQMQSVALLMVDLTEAFYRVLRPLAVGCEYTDFEIAQVANKLKLEPDVVYQLHQHLAEQSATAQAGMKPHYQSVLAALHTDTFFKLPGQRDQSRTTIGSRPGDSFADVVFTFLFSRVIQNFQIKLGACGLQTYVDQLDRFDPFVRPPPIASDAVPYNGPVWMDDLCLCFAAPSSEAVLQKATVATSLLLDTLEEHAMTPNLKPGKTELLVSLRGRGVRAVKARLFGPNSTRSLPILGEHRCHSLSVVGQYQHLGGLLHHGGDHRHEMRRRVAIAHQSFNRLRKSIFGNKAIALDRKAQLFDSLIMSKLLYGCESWVLRTWQHKQFLHSAIMRLYRRLLGVRHDAALCDDSICVALNVLTPTELLRRARLRYLGTLHRCFDAVTWDVLHSDLEWCALVRDDLCWMWNQISTSSSLSDPASSLASWRYLWCYHGGYWKGLIKRACLHACLQRSNDLQVRQGHHQILDLLSEQGSIVPGPLRDVAPVVVPPGKFGCLGCQRAFRSRAGEGAHMFRCHGIISSLRWLYDGTACPSCLREYHSVDRLQAHLRHHDQCRQVLQNLPPIDTPCAGIGSQTHREQGLAANGLVPPLPGEGPHRCPAPVRDILDFDTDLYADIAEVLMDDSTTSQRVAAIRAAGSNRCSSWTSFTQTLRQARCNISPDDLQQYGFDTMAQLDDFFEILLTADDWSFFAAAAVPPRRITPTKEDLFVAFSASCPVPCVVQPRSFGVHRMILHAFSGRRRHGDFQEFVEACVDQNPGIVLHVVSVDIVLSSLWGDVTRKETQQMWFHAIRQKYVVAYLAGPPCETWSKAREVAQETGRHGPRVVRTRTALWGLGTLSVKEIKQVYIGNALMMFSLLALVHLSGTGGCGALEHPAEPSTEHSASIWRTEIVALLLKIPGFERITFAQGLLGARSPKPTTLLLLNLPQMSQWIHRSRLCADLPKASSIGRSKEGHWNTMSLKEYPPALCKALAGCISAAVSELEVDTECVISPEFWSRCSTMVSDRFDDCIGPDFAG